MRMLSLFLLLTSACAFGASESCPATDTNIPFRIAYAQHLTENENGKTLSLRVSVATSDRSPEVLQRVGCAIAAKYANERRWHALIFSDYNAAKNYKAPFPDEKEPSQYIGECIFHPEKFQQVLCAPEE